MERVKLSAQDKEIKKLLAEQETTADPPSSADSATPMKQAPSGPKKKAKPAKKKAAAKLADKKKPAKAPAKVPAKADKNDKKKSGGKAKAAAKPKEEKEKQKEEPARDPMPAVDAVAGKMQFLRLRPDKIVIPEGWNPRIDYGDMQTLKDSIRANGVQTPILVRRVKNEFHLASGYRRLRACLELMKEGLKDLTVPAREQRKNISDPEAMIENIVSNEGKAFTPLEEAEAFRRLIGWGMSEEDVAKRVGKSLGTVKSRLMLIDAAPSVKRAVHKGEIPMGIAKKLIKASGGKVKEQESMLKDFKEKATTREGKKKAARDMEDASKAQTRSRISGKRARELLQDIASSHTRFKRSRKPPSMDNAMYREREKKLDKLREMKRRGMFV